ncbi:vomeromodulin-like [Sciurus carolinensis]|uniref:vomeromodulin-like n=1 Tax=Sciurus carolinensis TaxID=30640 RepID=UPI001FB52332|nr:vomeromodulin-like [Sciurus carolinensis]
MWTLWAVAVLWAIKAGALDVLQVPSGVGNLPVRQVDVPNLSLPLVSGPRQQVLRNSSVQRSPLPRKPRASSTKGRCKPAVKYFLSSSKLDDYLNATLPPQIEQLLKCKEVDVAGILGEVLSMVGKSGLPSLLDLTSLLDIGGDGGLGGILSQGSSGSPLDSLSKATGAVGNLLPLGQEALGGLLPSSADRNGGRGLLDSTGLSSLQEPLSDVMEKANGLKESAQDVVKGALPPGVNDAVSGLLGNIDLEELLLGLEVQEVIVKSMDSSVAGNEIHVDATTTATIGGKGLAGPVINILGFQVQADVTLKIAISANNTQCVDLEVQETHINANEVTLLIVKTVTETLPLPAPVPLPLSELIPQLLTVELNKKVQETDSCDIVLSDFNDCKNSTGLFKFQVKSSRISPQGLSIFYCAEAAFGKNTVPVLGGVLPPNPKNANISMTLSHMMLKTIIKYVAKLSSVKADDLEASITKITYAFQPESTIRATYWTDIRKDEESYATGKTTLVISHECKISRDKLIADIKLRGSDHSVNPPDASDEVQDLLSAVLKKFLSTVSEWFKQWNVPPGVSSQPMVDAKVIVIKSVELLFAPFSHLTLPKNP